jgi:hypothetical protein
MAEGKKAKNRIRSGKISSASLPSCSSYSCCRRSCGCLVLEEAVQAAHHLPKLERLLHQRGPHPAGQLVDRVGRAPSRSQVPAQNSSSQGPARVQTYSNLAASLALEPHLTLLHSTHTQLAGRLTDLSIGCQSNLSLDCLSNLPRTSNPPAALQRGLPGA